MNKKNIFFVFLSLFIFIGTNKILAEGENPGVLTIEWYTNDGKIKQIIIERNKNKSVCAINESTNIENYDFCKDFAWKGSHSVMTYNGVDWDKRGCSRFEICVNKGSIDDINGMAECVNYDEEKYSCTTSDYFNDTEFDKSLQIRFGDWGCYSSGDFVGRCGPNGFMCETKCSDTIDFVGLGLDKCQDSVTPSGGGSFETGNRKYFICINEASNDCSGVDLKDGQSKCKQDNTGRMKIKVICNKGVEKEESCSPGNCYGLRGVKAECRNDDNTCYKDPNGKRLQETYPTLNSSYPGGYVGCINKKQIFRCINPPKIKLGENCDELTPKLECFEYPDKNKAECKSEDDINIYMSKIKTKVKTNFWCKDKTNNEIDTAIGCIPIVSINGLITKLLPNIFGIAGGIAFLMMVYGFVMISTSSGDEKKVQSAKQIVTSAIIGLLVSVFSLFLYKLIAVQILQIPGIK